MKVSPITREFVVWMENNHPELELTDEQLKLMLFVLLASPTEKTIPLMILFEFYTRERR